MPSTIPLPTRLIVRGAAIDISIAPVARRRLRQLAKSARKQSSGMSRHERFTESAEAALDATLVRSLDKGIGAFR